jgi:hypothetical protein
MKRCPRCNRVFEDDSLRFCLEDGAALVTEVPPTIASPTMVLPPAQNNAPTLRQVFPPDVQAPPNWQMPATSPTQKRSPLLLIIAVMSILIVGLGIGLAVMLYRSSKDESAQSRANLNGSGSNQANPRSADNSQKTNEADNTSTVASNINSAKQAPGKNSGEAWQKVLGRWKSEDGTLVVDIVEGGPGIEGRVIRPSSKWPNEIQPGAINFRSAKTSEGQTINGTCMQLPQPGDCPNLVNSIKYDPCSLTLDESGDNLTFRQRHRLYNARTCQWTSRMAEEDIHTWRRVL